LDPQPDKKRRSFPSDAVLQAKVRLQRSLDERQVTPRSLRQRLGIFLVKPDLMNRS
jgi:hypothetical protein